MSRFTSGRKIYLPLKIISMEITIINSNLYSFISYWKSWDFLESLQKFWILKDEDISKISFSYFEIRKEILLKSNKTSKSQLKLFYFTLPMYIIWHLWFLCWGEQFKRVQRVNLAHNFLVWANIKSSFHVKSIYNNKFNWVTVVLVKWHICWNGWVFASTIVIKCL